MRLKTPSSSPVPRPLLPRTPVPCESSTTRKASYSDASSMISGSGASEPSIEKTPSVTMTLLRDSRVASSARRRCGIFRFFVTLLLRLRQADAVDDRSVIQLVGDDRVLL